MLIGILALQGAFLEHAKMLDRLGVPHYEIRNLGTLRPMDGLILPGGESTTMGKLLRDEGLFEPLRDLIKNGLPVFATCAGLILLAKKIDNDARSYFATMNVDVVRNAYGRQLGSFRTEAPMDGIGTIPMVFIRAPYVARTNGTSRVLATVDGHIVAVREGNQLGTAFHPELSENLSVHRYFIEIIKHNLQ
ncbi:MAG TPA: pyridoxal 5'-phosphate synthase glutaminase subunit PdxT [Acholeplasmatales bacterium]|nr:pyridoxal 5'-phosphate synthase glutaminase subunit PdxT [Acholeplasmatales bacterium]